MPRRKKNAQAEPSFAFLEPQVAVLGNMSTRCSTKASRSHAAYWGGQVQRFEKPKDSVIATSVNSFSHEREIHTTEISLTDVYEIEPIPSASPDQCDGSRPATTGFLATTSISRNASVNTSAFFRRFTTVPDSSTEQVSGTLGNCKAVAPIVLQRPIIEQFAVPMSEYCLVIPTVCALLRIAQFTALTGKGRTADLLGLKVRVIRSVSRELHQGRKVPSLQCIGGILSLGSPIVSLVSQDLPQGLSIEDYVEASMRDKTTCNKDFALAAKRALHESGVHWRQLQDLLPKWKGLKRPVGQFDVMGYLLRYMYISTQLGGDVSRIACLDTMTTVPATCTTRSPITVSDPWTSPFTTEWLDESAGTGVETPTNVLGRLMHGWVTTFLDRNDEVIESTDQTICQRLWFLHELYQNMENSTVRMPEGAVYASCRWAASVILKAEQSRVSFHMAAEEIIMQPSLVRCLRMTNLVNLWGRQKGLLFWVTSVCHLATSEHCFPLLTTALYAQFAHDMALAEGTYGVALRTLKRLRKFEKVCCGASDYQ